jgi:hypothetical protein
MTRDPKIEVHGLLAAGERLGDELNTPQETLALLKILALGNQDVAEGKTKPAAEIIARLRAKPLNMAASKVRQLGREG